MMGQYRYARAPLDIIHLSFSTQTFFPEGPISWLMLLPYYQTYFDRKKLRVDPVVAANVLGCFYRYGRGQQLEGTLQYVRDVIFEQEYIQGTRYYSTADCCLFFFGRLLQSSRDQLLQETLHSLLVQRTGERVGQPGSALDLAMRILTCDLLGLECSVDRQALAKLQYEDGGWHASPMYQYGSTGLTLGNRGVTTALAVKALACGYSRPLRDDVPLMKCSQSAQNEGRPAVPLRVGGV